MQKAKGSWTKVGAMTALLCVCVGLTYGFLPSWIRYPWVHLDSHYGFVFPIVARVRYFCLAMRPPALPPCSGQRDIDSEKEKAIHDFVHGNSQTFYGYDVRQP